MIKKKRYHELTREEVREIKDMVLECGDRQRVARLLSVSIKAVDLVMSDTFQGGVE